MRIPKWFKRDRSDRRCSDSQAVMSSSDTLRDNLSSRSDHFNDPIRTEEHRRACAEFCARRSLGPIKENYPTIRQNHYDIRKNDEQRTLPEKKNKRYSLPDTTIYHSEFTSSAAPHIQISFNNQLQLRSSKRSKNPNSSLTSTSPDLLPPRFMRNRHVDFDDCDNPSSPPTDFFRDNSLPYYDKENSTFDVEILNVPQTPRSKKKKRRNSKRSPTSEIRIENDVSNLENVLGESQDSNNRKRLDDDDNTDTVDAQFGSAVRKLEQMCQVVKNSNCTHFRGIPLINYRTLDIVNVNVDKDKKNIWHHATWNSIPVYIKKYPKQNLLIKSAIKDIPVNRYTFTDIDILTTIRHSNILLLMSICCEENTNLFTIFEDSIGSLYEYTHVKANKLSTQTTVNYLSGIVNALLYLNSNKFIHTSVSSHNILLTSSNVAKLCGFEMCTKIINDDSLCQNNKILYNTYTINYSTEHEYENVKELNSAYDDNKEYENFSECLPQNKSVREYFSDFRWQAPELFHEINGLVYPNVKTDVYSLCLVLWECFNNLIPWKTLTYEKLSELYLNWHRGIKLNSKESYPPVIYDILSKGLSLKPDDRCNIQYLYKQFSFAVNYFKENNFENNQPIQKKDVCISCDDLKEQNSTYTKTKNSENSKQYQITPITSKLGDIKKYPVTNLDESCDNHKQFLNQNNVEPVLEQNDSNESTSLLGLPSKESLANTEIFLIEESYVNSFQNTDSTEYCSILTPNIKKLCNKLSSNETLHHTSKLYLNMDITPDRESSLSDKILKLNTSLTPKSYKPLHIESPSPDTIDNIRSLTNSFELRNTMNKSTYSFDIENTSLPITPIARNNKIKKNAWLSGKTDLYNVETKNSLSQSNIIVENITTSNLCSKSYSNIDTQTELIPEPKPIRINGLSISHRCIGTETEDRIDGFNPFRQRSHSLNGKCGTSYKSDENFSGVDIKPIVAIHEKWIMEARKKNNRSFSLPDNYRGLYAVKPASHLTDPARPNNGGKSSIDFSLELKSDKNIRYGCYSDIPPLIRAAVTKKRVINSSTLDFFENSLWRKEKEKCMKQTILHTNPQNSSTPKLKLRFCDKSTNTESIDELCQKIVGNFQRFNSNKPFGTSDKNDIAGIDRFDSINMVHENDSEIQNAKSSLLAELTLKFETLAKRDKDETTPKKNKLDNTIENNLTYTLLSEKNDNNIQKECDINNLLFETSENNYNIKNKEILFCDDCDSNNIEDDCISLPDKVWQTESEDVINKSLKRCQAFPALQDARSTEDMYIDDELTANIDMQTLSENMKLVPLPSNLHEASCDKGQECCLIQIQHQNKCNKILLFCGNSINLGKDNAKMDDLCFYDEDDDLIKLHENDNLHMEHNDILSSNNKLSVIEEKSDEDQETDGDSVKSDTNVYIGSGRVVQDLISLYEGENLQNISKRNKSLSENCKLSQNEVSVIMLDDDLNNVNEKSPIRNHCSVNLNNSRVLVEDIIHF